MILREHFTRSEIIAAVQRWGSGEHHPLGPSSLWRCVCCPASALANIVCEGADNSSEHAERGTRIHKAIELWISKGIEPDCDSDEAQHLERAKVALGKAPRLWDAEVRLEITGLYFGTADAVKIRNEIGLIIDWKTGRQAEMAEESQRYQLGHLAYALMFQHPQVHEVLAKAVYTETGTESETLRFYREDLQDYIAHIAKLAEACRSEDARFAAETGPWCKYCKAAVAGRCPVARAEAERDANSLGVSLPESSAVMSLEDADSLLLKCKVVSKAVADMEDRAKAVIKEAGGSANFAAITMSGKRKTDWEGLCRHAFSLLGQQVPEEAIEKFTAIGEPSVQIRERKGK